jgi:hypothetical protein
MCKGHKGWLPHPAIQNETIARGIDPGDCAIQKWMPKGIIYDRQLFEGNFVIGHQGILVLPIPGWKISHNFLLLAHAGDGD